MAPPGDRFGYVTVDEFLADEERSRVKHEWVSGAVLVKTATAYYYPDVVLTCRPSDDDRVEEHPCFIVEVTSRSTKSIDRREKMNAYTALASLQDYWIVDPERRSVEVWHRSADGWARATFMSTSTLPVTCLGLDVAVADIFADL